MSKSIEGLTSFSSGEWSQTLTARVDQLKYKSACLQLRNMLCLKTGPAARRPGTQMMAPTKVIPGGDYCARVEDFQYSVDTTFVLEWGHHYVRFYSNGQQVVLATAPNWDDTHAYQAGEFCTSLVTGLIYYCFRSETLAQPEPSSPAGAAFFVQQSIYEVPTPYSALVAAGSTPNLTEVYQLQFAPINDVIYICSKNHPRAKITRFGDEDWVYQEVLDLVPALLDQNATDTTISASSTTGATTLTASAPPWVTNNYYSIGSSVLEGGLIYECTFPHISGVFADDLATGWWTLVTIFQSGANGHDGSYWELAYLRPSDYIEYDGVAASGFTAGTSNTITAFGNWEVHTYGVWSADIQIQASTDGGIIWQTVRYITGRNDRNVDVQGTAAIAQLYRIVVTNVAAPVTAGPTDPRVVFECVDSFLFGVVQIIEVNGPYSATALVITQLTVADVWVSDHAYSVNDRVGYNGVNYIALNAVTSTTPPPSDATNWSADGWPTIYWSEGAWSHYRGFPAAITSFEQRVWCGFSAFEPQRIWGTQIDDIENWDLGDQTLATDGVAFDLDAVGDGAILWMQAQDALFVGLVSGEYVVSSSDNTQAIGPANVTSHRQSRWGSNENLPAIVVGDALVFAQRQGFSLRQMLFSIATNKWMSQDLTALSDTVLNGGAFQVAYQKQGQKNGFVWATTANGEIVAMTYELDQEIFGWSRHYTGLGIDAGFESVCTIAGKGTNDDEVWVVVKRMINGVATRFVERINPINWQTIIPQPGQTPGFGPDKNQAYFVDCGMTVTNPPSNVFTGLGYLEGRTVAVCINALDYGRSVVTGGQITVPDFSPSDYEGQECIVQIGLPFSSTVQPMNLDVDVHTGGTQGIRKKVSGLTISFLNTLSCTATPGPIPGVKDSKNEIIFRESSNPLGEIPLYTGVKQIRDFGGDYGLNIPVILFTDGPLPLTVLGVAIAYNLSGKP